MFNVILIYDMQQYFNCMLFFVDVRVRVFITRVTIGISLRDTYFRTPLADQTCRAAMVPA